MNAIEIRRLAWRFGEPTAGKEFCCLPKPTEGGSRVPLQDARLSAARLRCNISMC